MTKIRKYKCGEETGNCLAYFIFYTLVIIFSMLTVINYGTEMGGFYLMLFFIIVSLAVIFWFVSIREFFESLDIYEWSAKKIK